MALHERVVGLLDLTRAEGLLEEGVGRLALRNDHEPRRADVEALHDALPLGSPGGADPEPGSSEVLDDRRTVPAEAGVGGDAGRLVDDDDVGVVVDDRDAGHLRRRDGDGACRGDLDLEHVAGTDAVGLADDDGVDQHSPGFGEVLDPAAGQPGHAGRSRIDAVAVQPVRHQPDASTSEASTGLLQSGAVETHLRDHGQPDADHGRCGDEHVGDVEDGEVGQLDEVDDVPAERPGLAEQTVGEVAGDAGQQAARWSQPSRRAGGAAR